MVSHGAQDVVLIHRAVEIEGELATVVVDAGEHEYVVFNHEHGDDEELEHYSSVCLHCLIEEQPELGRALDLAHEHGEAQLVDGEWRGVASNGNAQV